MYFFIKGIIVSEVLKRVYCVLIDFVFSEWELWDVELLLVIFYEVFILVSIIEKEMVVFVECDMILGVFVNRLNRNMCF